MKKLVLILSLILILVSCTVPDNTVSQDTVSEAVSCTDQTPSKEETSSFDAVNSAYEKAYSYLNTFGNMALFFNWEYSSSIPPERYVLWYAEYCGGDKTEFEAQALEETVEKYFGVSKNHLRSDPKVYLKEQNIYTSKNCMPLSCYEFSVNKVDEREKSEYSSYKCEIEFTLILKDEGKKQDMELKIDEYGRFYYYYADYPSNVPASHYNPSDPLEEKSLSFGDYEITVFAPKSFTAKGEKIYDGLQPRITILEITPIDSGVDVFFRGIEAANFTSDPYQKKYDITLGEMVAKKYYYATKLEDIYGQYEGVNKYYIYTGKEVVTVVTSPALDSFKAETIEGYLSTMKVR